MASQAGNQQRRLRGRDRECGRLRELISTAESGTSQVLVFRGEAGVGKTALLDYVSEQARGFRRVQVAGVESDMELAFAGLHLMCAPLMDRVDQLPEPQSAALNVAFGRGTGPTPDRFLVGLAVLSLLAAAADEQPLLCVIDDAQWLDHVSAHTLAFVARRLLAEPVGLVFATRDGGAEALAGLPELMVDGLTDRYARLLLNDAVLGQIDKRVEDRIVSETRGIPLALLEVPRNIAAEELSGGFPGLGVRHSADQVERGFIARIKSLPPDSQLLLLLAAVEPVGDAALFLRAAAALGIAVDALAPAEAAGLIEFGPRMRFHHPLVRSAAYFAADLADRRAIHRVLADVIDFRSDPDRRAWHAANAAAGPDDVVAADLEASADRARRRGGIVSAAAFLERATALTADPALRSARALAAAQAKRDAAAPAAADQLLAIAEMGSLTDLQQAEVAHLRAQMEFARGRGGDDSAPRIAEAASKLLDAARQLEGLDDDLARETYLEALVASMYAGRLGGPDALANTASAARAAVERVATPRRPIDFLLSGLANQILGDASAAYGPLHTAVELMLDRAKRDDGEVLHWTSLGLTVAAEVAPFELWDETMWEQLATAAVRQARAAGALAVLPSALAYRAGVHVYAGEFGTAATLIDEANSITVATGYAPLRYHALSLTAWRGVPEDALRLLEGAAAAAAARGEGRALDAVSALMSAVYNGLGRYQEAFATAHAACEFVNLGLHGWSLLELVEAAVRTGEHEAAAAAAQRLIKRTSTGPTDFARGAAAYARALITDDDSTEGHYLAAIECLGRTRMTVCHARACLLYGEWLRRVNRRLDARRQLNEAHDMFTRMGAQAFAERARRELVAVGEKVRTHRAGAVDELTAQEAQIAELARGGLTNQEIGAQLFISTHTVEWHLRKVFVKLGISSRRQLRTAYART